MKPLVIALLAFAIAPFASSATEVRNESPPVLVVAPLEAFKELAPVYDKGALFLRIETAKFALYTEVSISVERSGEWRYVSNSAPVAFRHSAGLRQMTNGPPG